MTAVDSARPAASVLPPPPPPAAMSKIALFLDVDGTLVDFASHPDEVVVDPALPEGLKMLRERLGGALAPLSGRALHEIDALLALDTAAAGGLHGAELRAADGRMLARAEADSRLDAARRHAIRTAASIPGVLLEDKGTSLALHFRNAPEAESDVAAIAERTHELAGAGYKLLRGNRVFEIKPLATDKGTALAALMRIAPFKGRTPWMIGDDVTDEDAFEAANAHGGVSVIVGPRRPTRAHFAFRDPAAARAWIAELANGTEGTRR